MHIRTRQLRPRRGAIAVLVALAIPVLLILSAFAMNVAYMQMVREQLRVTCDASAKAALVNYGTYNSQSTAISNAQTVANLNLVAGSPLAISTGDVVFGNATQGGSGVYAFTAGGTPVNAVQLTGTVKPSLFMTAFLPITKFQTTQVSTATRVAHDICLVLDRSASMAFDLSSNEYEYPTYLATPAAPTPVASSGSNALALYFTPPSSYSSTPSRWYELNAAVTSFISTLTSRNLDVHVALVTYAETYSLGTYSATEASTDQTLTASYSSLVPTALNNYGYNANSGAGSPLLGGTNISAGMALAQAELTSSRARTIADRTIILITDGNATSGSTNISAITQTYCQSYQIVTQVITVGAEASSGSVQTAMQQAAA
ncbi:MAG TPA: pilus assembly protein TadG-related protein, partial [Pirellulales bacterium]